MKHSINVLHLVLSMGLSGRGISIVELVRNLDNTRYKCTVCCFDEKGILAEEFNKIGIEVIVLNRKPGFDIMLIYKLIKIMKNKKIDVVHAHNTGPLFYGSFAAKLAGIPVFIDTIHWPINSTTWSQRIQNKICSYLTDKIVTITEYMQNDFSRRNRIPLSKFETIYYGVDLEKYSSTIDIITKKKSELGIDTSDILLGTVARLVPEKGHATLLYAIRKVIPLFPLVKLVLIGDGPLRHELEKLVNDLEISKNVVFLGYRTDIPNIMPIFDIFILPSNFEPFGLVLLEAMAAKKAIIATNITEIPRIVKNGETGILVPPNDVSLLSKAILDLMQNSSRRQAMGKSGRELVSKKFSLNMATTKYASLYQNILEKKTNPKRKRKFRIMHVVLSLKCGGLENLVIELSSAMDKKTFYSTVCCLDTKGDLSKKAEFMGIDIVEMHRKPGFDLLLIMKLASVLRENRIDIVHTHNPTAHFYGTLAARLALVPIVVNTRHGAGSEEKPEGSALLWMLTNKVIAVSQNARDKLLRNDALNTKKVITIPNGIDIKNYERGDAGTVGKEILAIDDSAPLIGIVARLSIEKDHKTLLEAFRILSQKLVNAKLVIIGDGYLRQELEEFKDKIGLNGKVIFLGYREDIPNLLRLIDVFVLSSSSEGLSLTLLEAMAAGKPIVATSVGGNPEVVLDGITGKLVPPHNPQALAEALLNILGNADIAKTMGDKARERVRNHFTLERLVKDHERLYLELIGMKFAK